jgi:F0F1-type ATP synthase assembly protein I
MMSRMTPTDPQSTKQFSNLMALSSMGIELVLCIAFVAAIGFGIDYLLGSFPVGFIVGLILGTIVGFYQLIRSALRVSDKLL